MSSHDTVVEYQSAVLLRPMADFSGTESNLFPLGRWKAPSVFRAQLVMRLYPSTLYDYTPMRMRLWKVLTNRRLLFRNIVPQAIFSVSTACYMIVPSPIRYWLGSQLNGSLINWERVQQEITFPFIRIRHLAILYKSPVYTVQITCVYCTNHLCIQCKSPVYTV